MSFKDKFDRMIEYFTEDGDEYDVQEAPAQAVGASQPVSSPKPVQPSSKPRPKAVVAAKEQKPTPVAASRPQVTSTAVVESASSQKSPSENITRLHQRQQELARNRSAADEKITIDVRYPRKYEEATEIVDLLLANESILIDFQYMTEVQARRCLDYLDGARYVLAGNLRRVASTMYLLTPINVVVNIEDIRLPNDVEIAEYDFDMKRNR